MKTLRAAFSRVFGLFGRDCRDSELQAELESHLQMHVDDYLHSGMSPEEARRQAMLKLGGVRRSQKLTANNADCHFSRRSRRTSDLPFAACARTLDSHVLRLLHLPWASAQTLRCSLW